MQLFKHVEAGLGFVGVLLVVGMAILLIVSVVLRYVFNAPLQWSDELARLILVWITFLGAALATKRQKEIVVDVLDVWLSERLKKVVKSLADLLTIAFTAYLLVYGVKMSQFAWMIKSDSLRVPYTVFYAAVPVGALITLIYLVLRLIYRFKGMNGKPNKSEGRA